MINLHILLDPVSDFWKCPEMGFKKLFFAFFNHIFFYKFGLIGSVKTVSKVLGVGMNECRPIYGLHFVYIQGV